jgi:TATA-box binding protein (TBP) (component of TFIID and TFIIIB)
MADTTLPAFQNLTDFQKTVVLNAFRTLRSTNYVASTKLCTRNSAGEACNVTIPLATLALNNPNFIYNPKSFAAGNMTFPRRGTLSIYQRGKLICMGMPDTAESLLRIYQCICLLNQMGVPCELDAFDVHNMVFCAFIHHHIDLERLFKDSAKSKAFAKYDDEIFPALTIQCKLIPGFTDDITVLIFGTSKANITGAKTEEIAERNWWKLLCEVLIHYIIVGAPQPMKSKKLKRQQQLKNVSCQSVYEQVAEWSDDDDQEKEGTTNDDHEKPNVEIRLTKQQKME